MTFAQASTVQSDLVMCRSDDPGSGSLTSTGGSSPVTRNSGRHDNAVLDLLFSGPHDVVLRPGRSLQVSNMNRHGKVTREYRMCIEFAFLLTLVLNTAKPST